MDLTLLNRYQFLRRSPDGSPLPVILMILVGPGGEALLLAAVPRVAGAAGIPILGNLLLSI